MTVGVIDGLEAIDIEHGHAEEAVLTACPLHLEGELGHNRASVESAGQGIRLSLAGELVLHRLELRVQLHESLANPQAGPQFLRHEGLDDVIVGSCIQTRGEFFLGVFCGEKNEVWANVLGGRPHQPADIRAVQPGHDPVEHGQCRGILGSECSQSLVAVFDGDHIVSPRGQKGIQQ